MAAAESILNLTKRFPNQSLPPRPGRNKHWPTPPLPRRSAGIHAFQSPAGRRNKAQRHEITTFVGDRLIEMDTSQREVAGPLGFGRGGWRSAERSDSGRAALDPLSLCLLDVWRSPPGIGGASGSGKPIARASAPLPARTSGGSLPAASLPPNSSGRKAACNSVPRPLSSSGVLGGQKLCRDVILGRGPDQRYRSSSVIRPSRSTSNSS